MKLQPWYFSENHSMHTDQTKHNFNKLYQELTASVAAAKAEVAALNVTHEDGQREIGGMVEKLQAIYQRFDSDQDLLAQHAEWDKFTIAFFGETNAGKSTIIESLRMLFSEESRQELLQANGYDLVKYEATLAKRMEQVRQALQAAYEAVAAEVQSIKSDTAALALILEREAEARNKILEDEALSRVRVLEGEAEARNKIVEDEASSRLRIAQEESSARVRMMQFLMAAAGLVAGLALALPLLRWMGY